MNEYLVLIKTVARVLVRAKDEEDAAQKAPLHVEHGNAAFSEPEVLEVRLVSHD